MGTFVTANPHVPLPANKTDGPRNPPKGLSYELDASDVNNTQGAANDLFTHADAWVNVKSFGADPTGLTDSAPAIRSALALLASRGRGRLLFPQGTYLLNSFGPAHAAFPLMDFVFELPSNVHLLGEPGAKLKVADGLINSSALAWKGHVFIANGQRNVTFENLEIDFNGANNLCTLLPWPYYGLYAVDTSNILLRKCYWHDTTGKNFVITYGAGATVTPSATGLVVEDCEFKNGGTSIAGNTMQDDFSAVYSTNLGTRVNRCHIHHDARPFTFSGGVELHASDSQVTNCTIEDSYPGVYFTSDVAGGLTGAGLKALGNNFKNCHSAIVFPSCVGDCEHLDVSGNTATLERFTSLPSFTSDFIIQTQPAGIHDTDWTNYTGVIRYMNVHGNTVQSLNGTEADLKTGGVSIQSAFMVSVQGNKFFDLSGAPLSIWGSPYQGQHIRFTDNVCVDFGNHSHVSNPRPGVAILLGGSSTTPSVAAYTADDIVVEGNVFTRTSLLANSSIVFTGNDVGSALNNWLCHNNVSANLSAQRLGSNPGNTPVTDAYARTQIVTTTPVTISSDVSLVLVNCASACTINLPAFPSAGKEVVVKDISGAAVANNITVQTTNAVDSNIEAALSQAITVNYGVLRLAGDGTAYWTDGATSRQVFEEAIIATVKPVSADGGPGTEVLYSGRVFEGWAAFAVDFNEWTANATSQTITLCTLPPSTRVLAVIAETDTAYAGLAGTIALKVGTTSGGNELVLSHDVKSAAVTKGLLDADLGASISRAGAVQGGAWLNYVAQSSLYVTMTSGTGNLGTGSVTHMTDGSTVFYFKLETLA